MSHVFLSLLPIAIKVALILLVNKEMVKHRKGSKSSQKVPF
jgi:hypothetical protein